MLSLDNLTGAIAAVLGAPGPLRRPLIVADDEPLTVAEMIAAMRQGLGRSPGTFPIPGALLRAFVRAVGREEIIERLAGSLVVDASALRARLDAGRRLARRHGATDAHACGLKGVAKVRLQRPHEGRQPRSVARA